MAKEWILNSAMNRFQLNFKRNVGATSEAIRKCSPKSLEEWKTYYYDNVRSETHINELGKKLYLKITEILALEIEDISEEECIDYMRKMVIDKTYEGYKREKETIYQQLQKHIDIKIMPAPDKWDRLFNVDFYIEINGKFIGLQIKPVDKSYIIPEIYKEINIQAKTHEKFYSQFGGKVFYIYSYKEGSQKIIANEEIIDDIIAEIARLRSM